MSVLNWAFKGMLLGGIVGMTATAMMINRMQPSVGKSMMRKGRAMARRYRKKIANAGMF